MFRRVGLIAAAAALAALAVVTAASARPAALSGSASSAASCGTVQIGMLAPITGPAGSIGADQLHWAQFFVAQWNKAGSKPKLKLVQATRSSIRRRRRRSRSRSRRTRRSWA